MRKMNISARRLLGLSLFLGLTLVFSWIDSASTASTDVECGVTLEGDQKFELLTDLNCGQGSGNEITVKDKAQLDLRGHRIIGQVFLRGSKAVFKNGRIHSFEGATVSVQGSGHLIQDIFSRGDIPFVVTGTDHRLIGNTAFDATHFGFEVSGKRNLLQSNVSSAGATPFIVEGEENRLIHNSGSRGSGEVYAVGGNKHVLIHNFATHGDQTGFSIHGDQNHLSRNISSESPVGISVDGSNNRIEANVLSANGTDLVDQTANCGTNIWRRNTFRTRNRSCIR